LVVAISFFGMLYALNLTYHKQQLETFKSFLVSLWVEISDYSFPDGFNIVNSKIVIFYKKIRKLILIVLVILITTFAMARTTDIFIYPDIDFLIELTTTFAHKINAAQIDRMLDMQKRVREFEVSDATNKECILPNNMLPENLPFSDYEISFQLLLNNSLYLDKAVAEFAHSNTLNFRFISLIGSSAAFATIACVFIFAFWVSTGFNIFLSQIFVKSGLSVFWICMTMIISSAIIPVIIPAITSTFFLTLIDLMEDMPKISLSYTDLGNQALFVFYFRIYLISFDMIFHRPAIFLGALLRGDITSVHTWATFLDQFIFSMKYELYSILYLLKKIYPVAFYELVNIDATSLTLNLTIISDLVFSLAMVMSVILNIIIAKNKVIRETLANIIQFIAESPEGPFLAISAAFSFVVYKVL